METQNKKGGAGKIILEIFLVLLSLFAVAAIIGGITRAISGDRTLTLATTIQRLMKGESLIQKDSQITGAVLTASTDGSSAELQNPNAGVKMQIAAADKSSWPQGVVGGLYELKPSQENFEQPLYFRMKLNKDPGSWFTLGYWRPDSGQWEPLPTVKVAENTYQTVLLHASLVGGSEAENYTPHFRNPDYQGGVDAMGAELQKIEAENATGENQGGDWEKVWKIAKEMTDKLIADFCAHRSATTMHDFFQGWQMVQNLMFSSLDARFAQAFYTDCGKKKEKANYEIVQVDTYDTAINLNLMQGMYNLNSKNKTQVISTGWPEGKIASDVYVDKDAPSSWKEPWEVYQGSILASDMDQKLYKEVVASDTYGLIDFKSKTGGEGTQLQVLTFDLTNVKEGGTFPIKMATDTGLLFRTKNNKLSGLVILKDQDGTFRWHKSDNKNTSEDFGKAEPVIYTGILLKDNGDDGAIIGFQEQYFTPEQMEQMKQIQKIAKSGPAELRNLWGENGKPNFMSGDLTPKPLVIKKSVIHKEEFKDESEDYKNLNRDLESQRQQNEKQKQEEEDNDKNKKKNGDEGASAVPNLDPEVTMNLTNQ